VNPRLLLRASGQVYRRQRRLARSQVCFRPRHRVRDLVCLRPLRLARGLVYPRHWLLLSIQVNRQLLRRVKDPVCLRRYLRRNSRVDRLRVRQASDLV
jgi:hypothetical protein